ncbi:OsmC family peroxiredoxin [Hymenobacter lapidiphilus]|uniref:OsmC family peroxiredoxin n=1 Tax=Hymenobacter sp. CCM 8763 TaxID=2303334 RepID=UPI000E34306B|nr:OsmC family peroxiredoxin [Hymenobacter sp. CCM 8763]RFP65546.1 OsmC family peroxiredoxin [Hymenobacter sp. CCM 8763]
MAYQRGNAVWRGDITGSGEIWSQSGAVRAVYATGALVDGQKSTNPEELLATAHASCFTIFLAQLLSLDGKPAQRIQTESKATIDTSGDVPKVVGISLSTEAEVAGLTPEEFQQYAESAKENCLISQLLKGSLDLQLVAARLKHAPEPGN